MRSTTRELIDIIVPLIGQVHVNIPTIGITEYTVVCIAPIVSSVGESVALVLPAPPVVVALPGALLLIPGRPSFHHRTATEGGV